MPPKSKRKKQMEAVRDGKRCKVTEDSGATTSGDEQHQEQSTAAASVSNTSSEPLTLASMSDYDSEDATFEPQAEEFDEEASIYTHAQEWVESLGRDDLLSLSILLWYLLVNILQFQLTEAAKLIGRVLGRSDRTVREWRAVFRDNNGVFPDTLQGKYQREGVLWQNEEMNKIATKYVRENTVVKGKPNLTTLSFCKWVNEVLLPNHVLVPGFPRKVSIETARKWLHELGFYIRDHRKGTYVDGHERSDVVEYRNSFLRKLCALGFLNILNAPTPEAALALPKDLECPSADQVSKTVVIFHDESTFQANDDQKSYWGTKDMIFLRPKSRGAGIMVSDFIDEHTGYLRLTEEFTEKSEACPELKRQARAFLEYGENKEGYWTSEKFMQKFSDAVKIAEAKYPRDKGYKVVWIFDHSSCHGAYAEDALNAHRMNAKPGGKQLRMRDTVYKGTPQRLVFNMGIPKGLRQVLKERNVDTRDMKLEDMRIELASHHDFREEKTKIEHFLNSRGHICMLLPKFHCEINPIERIWAQAKRYTRAHVNYTLNGLRKNVPGGLDSVTPENITNHYRKIRHYMFGYLLGIAAGPELEEHVQENIQVSPKDWCE